MIRYQLLLLIICGLLLGCKNDKSSRKRIKEGIITYQVNYLPNEKDNPIVTLLPSTVDLKFKENNISLFSQGYLGFFSTRYISCYKGEQSHLLFKVLNNRFDYTFCRKEIAFIYKNHQDTRIEYCDSVKIIAGYDCKMAIIHYPDPQVEEIKVFYTHEISLKDPNRNTPFKDLKGVLLEFETTINNIDAQFVAVKVSEEKVNDTEFTVPDNYMSISQNGIQKFILDFQ